VILFLVGLTIEDKHLKSPQQGFFKNCEYGDNQGAPPPPFSVIEWLELFFKKLTKFIEFTLEY
jgi:hypothetical protein